MNIHKFFKDLPHYLPLIGVLTAGLLAFFIFSYDKQFQVGVAISVAVAHIVWGIVHHAIHKNLSFSVILEYLAISALGLAVIISVIGR